MHSLSDLDNGKDRHALELPPVSCGRTSGLAADRLPASNDAYL
jgi:hypothetical protein